jgi:hypothetical protein
MREWLHALPIGWQAAVVFGSTYLITALIYSVVQRLAVGERAKAFKAVSPGMLPPLGILFGLFVAFIASQVWNDHDKANTAVNREASALSKVIYLAGSFPGDTETRLRELLRRHLDEVLNVEWPIMDGRTVSEKGTVPFSPPGTGKSGQSPTVSDSSLRVTPHDLAEAMQLTLSVKTHSEGQITAQREILAALEDALEARRQRIIVSHAQVHGVKWACLLIQAACTLIAIALVHSDNRRGSAIALAIFSTGVAVSIFLVAAHDRPFGGAIGVKSALLAHVLPEETESQNDFDRTIAADLSALLRAARAVVSDHQDAINQRGGDRSFTSRSVIEETRARYARETGHPLPALDLTSTEGRLLQAELDAIEEVVDEAQASITDPEREFKDFIPAIFAYRVADRFNQKAGDLAYLKLTAPAELVRRKTNRPDEWENQMIKEKFQAAGWKKGEFVAEDALLNGREAYRLLIPEYYETSCLACHGKPKGERDITGGEKEGASLGDLGGSISVAIYLK